MYEVLLTTHGVSGIVSIADVIADDSIRAEVFVVNNLTVHVLVLYTVSTPYVSAISMQSEVEKPKNHYILRNTQYNSCSNKQSQHNICRPID